jgi:galactonate dehydratase
LRIAAIRFHGLGVSAKTVWTFLEVATEDGRSGFGECTLSAHEAALQAEVAKLDRDLRGEDFLARNRIARHFAHAPGGLVRATAISALDQALWDLAAQLADVPLVRALGGALRGDVRLYANVNRGVDPRTPENFAAFARRAVAQGFTAVKLAPFEGLMPETRGDAGWETTYKRGLDRIGAVRAAVPDAQLMVDCHWRFSPPDAARLISDLAKIGCWWVECPVSEALLPEIRRLRSMANDRGMRLAGAETLSGLERFRPLIEAGAYDVLMPDIKYCGGHEELRRIAALAASAGIEIALHNPSGPVCHAHSVHAACAIPNVPILEVMFDESPLFFSAMRGTVPALDGGRARPPDAPGLGCTPDMEKLASRPWAPIDKPFQDAQLG